MKDPIIKTTILGDGTVLENTYCGYSEPSLWCWVSGKTLLECAQMFSDPYKTSVITSYYYEQGYIYRGFTEVLLIQRSEKTIDVRLTWPEGGEHSVEEIDEDEQEET